MGTQRAYFTVILACIGVLTAGFVTKPGSETLKRVSSLYNGDLMVLEDAGRGARFLLAQSRQGLVLQSRIDLSHKQELTMGYFQVMALLTALHPKPSHVFNMGLGGGALPRFHLGQYPGSEVVSAEIDAAVIDLAKQFFFVSDPRHRILEGDGFEVLKRQPEKFDVVWVDTVTPKEGPKAYVPAKYLNVLNDHLSAGGMVVANLGEAKVSESFSGVQRSYRQRYAHGIRVRSPRPLRDETPDAILALVKAESAELAPALSPSFFVAAGDSPSLNCAAFWALYRKWAEAKSVSIDWGSAEKPEICADL